MNRKYNKIDVSQIRRLKGYGAKETNDYVIELFYDEDEFETETVYNKQEALKLVFSLMRQHNIKTFTYEVK